MKFVTDLPDSPVNVAIRNATKLTTPEIEHYIVPSRRAVEAFRVGKGNFKDWLRLCTLVNVGMAIEDGGVVKGLRSDLKAALDALEEIGTRQDSPQGWKSGALRATELESIRMLVIAHEFQLRQVSYGEHQEAYRLATARVKCDGGEVINLKNIQTIEQVA
ncbi:hypothetical protein [Acidovorax sp. Root70]|uniref:hypothetical protein n=1 Tax=Acidovorax sp. Root70 TaxID=1736590 RepID=UPI0006FB497C|nr:hypothetical protein [Acidovorax sp. Root70]KRB33383.1 hypothetical protein ASD94_22025 [Acidovorax sp. Root70]